MRGAKKVKEFRSILCFSADGGNKRFGDRPVAMQGGDLGYIYTKEEKDTIAGFLSKYAYGNTVPQNWRLFNMLDRAFLKMEGFPDNGTTITTKQQEYWRNSTGSYFKRQRFYMA